MGKVKITVVRHGETEWNKSMQLQGHSDSPLTNEGKKQVQLVAESLKYRKFDLLITSDLKRAVDTAECINKYHNLNTIYLKELRERAFGVMEGLTLERIRTQYPEVFKAYISRNAEYPVPGGESLTEFGIRVISILQGFEESYNGKHLLVVAHGGVLDCILRRIFGLAPAQRRCFSIFNTSVNTFVIDNSFWILDEWGNTDHLLNKIVLNEFN